MENADASLDYSLTMSGELPSTPTNDAAPFTPASDAKSAMLLAAASFDGSSPNNNKNNALQEAAGLVEQQKKPSQSGGNIGMAMRRAAGVVDREERVEVRDLTRKVETAPGRTCL